MIASPCALAHVDPALVNRVPLERSGSSLNWAQSGWTAPGNSAGESVSTLPLEALCGPTEWAIASWATRVNER
jgi:hypothetical protein